MKKLRAEKRERKKKKRTKGITKGGTLAGQLKRMQITRAYQGTPKTLRRLPKP